MPGRFVSILGRVFTRGREHFRHFAITMTRHRQVLGNHLRPLFAEVLVQHAVERFEQLVFGQAASLTEWGEAQKSAEQRDTLHADLQFPAAGLFFRNARGVQYPQL